MLEASCAVAAGSAWSAFALVLTHDVEGPIGLERVRPLMELEMRLGFRSCFNLIPEGLSLLRF